MGLGGAYGLDYNAVINVAKELCIEINQTFFEKIRAHEYEALNIIRNGKIQDRQKEAKPLNALRELGIPVKTGVKG